MMKKKQGLSFISLQGVTKFPKKILQPKIGKMPTKTSDSYF